MPLFVDLLPRGIVIVESPTTTTIEVHIPVEVVWPCRQPTLTRLVDKARRLEWLVVKGGGKFTMTMGVESPGGYINRSQVRSCHY